MPEARGDSLAVTASSAHAPASRRRFPLLHALEGMRNVKHVRPSDDTTFNSP